MRFIWNAKRARFPFNNRGDMKWLGPGIGQLFAGNDFFGTPPKANLPEQPALPDPNKAANDALTAQTAQRRTLLASGGQTNYAAGGGMLLGSDISSLNMGGA